MPLKPNALPSKQILDSYFSITSDFRLVNKISKTSRKAGEHADSHMNGGYRTVYVAGKLRLAHRVIWAMAHGRDPDGFLDHINGDTLDNRIENLREVSHSQNMLNKKIYKNSNSGASGIHLRSDNGMWRAYISLDGKRRYLGQYATKEEAQAALNPVREKLHGEYARAA